MATLGVCYNVFDGHELLRQSVLSVRSVASHVVVVWQGRSNFGNPARPFLADFLKHLCSEGIVDELIEYEVETLSNDEKKLLMCERASPDDVGGAVTASSIADQFFHELIKREMGRKACLRAGCTHFMSMDSDEFYDQTQLRSTLDYVAKHDYDAALCLMYHYMKRPTFRLQPTDDTNYVPAIYKCHPHLPFRLVAPYPALVDPTRRVEGVRRVLKCERSQLVMHHMSLVRVDFRSKLVNVSNRANMLPDVDAVIAELEKWEPPAPPPHPHALSRLLFKAVEVVEDRFEVDLSALCAVCFRLVDGAGAGRAKAEAQGAQTDDEAEGARAGGAVARPTVEGPFYCSDRCREYHLEAFARLSA